MMYKITYISADCPHPELYSFPEYQNVIFYEADTPYQAVRKMLKDVGITGEGSQVHNFEPVVWSIERLNS